MQTRTHDQNSHDQSCVPDTLSDELLGSKPLPFTGQQSLYKGIFHHMHVALQVAACYTPWHGIPWGKAPKSDTAVTVI